MRCEWSKFLLFVLMVLLQWLMKFLGYMQDVRETMPLKLLEHAVLECNVKTVQSKLQRLKSLSTTRWASRAEAISAIQVNYESVVNAIETMVEKVIDSKARTSGKAKAISAIQVNYESIVKAVETMVENVIDSKARTSGKGILSQIKSFNFILSLEIMHSILLMILEMRKTLQSSTIDLCLVIDHLQNLMPPFIDQSLAISV
ncbi:hypothetical protein PR048_012236 [Dryococelus australis]|uniref:Uncharacterized protein n=1 Tax=Dryococelus australis TaxID=614101 RepID=A0ABQ9HPC4_9NEOP|nr:hypothetical protein PR048_012236 [Dryococelus australis]